MSSDVFNNYIHATLLRFFLSVITIPLCSLFTFWSRYPVTFSAHKHFLHQTDNSSQNLALVWAALSKLIFTKASYRFSYPWLNSTLLYTFSIIGLPFQLKTFSITLIFLMALALADISSPKHCTPEGSHIFSYCAKLLQI